MIASRLVPEIRFDAVIRREIRGVERQYDSENEDQRRRAADMASAVLKLDSRHPYAEDHDGEENDDTQNQSMRYGIGVV